MKLEDSKNININDEENKMPSKSFRKKYDPNISYLEKLLNIYNIKNIDLVQKMECLPITISKLEKHKFTNVPINDAKKLANILNVTIDFVIFDNCDYAIKITNLENLYLNYNDYLLLKIHGIVNDKIIKEKDSEGNEFISCITHEINQIDALKYIYSLGMPFDNTKLKEILKSIPYIELDDFVLIKSSNKYYMTGYLYEIVNELIKSECPNYDLNSIRFQNLKNSIEKCLESQKN